MLGKGCWSLLFYRFFNQGKAKKSSLWLVRLARNQSTPQKVFTHSFLKFRHPTNHIFTTAIRQLNAKEIVIKKKCPRKKKGQGKSVFSSGKKQFISDPSSFFCTNISFHGSSTDPIFFNDPIWWKVKIESRGCYKTIFDNHWEVASKGHNLEFWLGSTAQILWKIVVPGYAFWWIALWRSFSQTLWNHRGQTSKKRFSSNTFKQNFIFSFLFF